MQPYLSCTPSRRTIWQVGTGYQSSVDRTRQKPQCIEKRAGDPCLWNDLGLVMKIFCIGVVVASDPNEACVQGRTVVVRSKAMFGIGPSIHLPHAPAAAQKFQCREKTWCSNRNGEVSDSRIAFSAPQKKKLPRIQPNHRTIVVIRTHN